ncbi:DUF5787 family protein [Halorussus gelatinilyticus]|uniref:DUF5787 family protein n=1 Tax=Halorussus gelatinilyticus TaxID=2937524 RepID=A0A8U0IEJ0_9EURY|nr:DUF5787 family protein [Halorussus gelatinilyticus]UPV99372.1 DUF5787 family protein [Halorussus gelatinilyticus]
MSDADADDRSADDATGEDGPDPEFVFELRTCRWAEREWPPGAGDDADDAESDRSDSRPAIVARQLGTKRRRWDTLVVEVDPEGFRRRANFGRKRLDSDLLDVIPHAPADWEYYRDALPDPGYPWRYVRETIHRADDRGILDVRKRNNRIQIRRKWAYPDWVERIVAVENKPDLDASAARDLAAQLEYDVALALADEVWVATRATGERVEPALLESVPVEAGILTIDGGAGSASGTRAGGNDPRASVEWFPRTLDVDAPGTLIRERGEVTEYGSSASQFDYADPEWKAQKRLEIAERAYEKGWRAFAETMRPDCRHFQLRREGRTLLPYCPAKACHQTSSECSGSYPEFSPEPPQWRTKNWPIEGGPGKGIRRLLEKRRERNRPG